VSPERPRAPEHDVQLVAVTLQVRQELSHARQTADSGSAYDPAGHAVRQEDPDRTVPASHDAHDVPIVRHVAHGLEHAEHSEPSTKVPGGHVPTQSEPSR